MRTISFTARFGLNKVRIGRHALASAHYVAVIRARDAHKLRSNKRTLRFQAR